MRTIKCYGGMTGEYEIIKTDAPDKVIEEQLRETNRKQETGENVDNPYDVIERNGYIVEIVGCQDDFDDEEPLYDMEFDFYDYFSDEQS